MSTILLSVGEHEIAVNVARCLGDVGESIVVIGVAACRGSILSIHCKSFYEIPMGFFGDNSNSLINLINQVAIQEQCEVIIPLSPISAGFLSTHREKFNSDIYIMPLSKPEIFQKLNNKWFLYCWLNELDLPVPRTILIENSEQASAPKLGFPVLTKPLQGASGRGIKYYWNEQDYKNAPPSQFPVIMQEYIPGWDISVSIYSIDGMVRGTTTYRSNEGGVTFLNNEEAVGLCRKVLIASNFSGLANFDLRFDERDGIIKCIECNHCETTLYDSCQAGLNFPLLISEIARYGYSSVPDAIAPQWMPNPRRIWLRNPKKAVSQWKVVYPITKRYIRYLQSNFIYEIYRIVYTRNINLADKLFHKVLAFNKYFRDKYIRIEA